MLEKEEVIDDPDTPIHSPHPLPTKFLKQLNQPHSKRLVSRQTKDNSDYDHHNKKIEILRNGNKIIAQWRNKQIHGEAEVYYHNGVVFKGEYHNGLKLRGHFYFDNGYQYVGDCLGNSFEGQGSLIFPSGKVMSGEWENSEIVGNAKIQYPSGEVYYGQVKNVKKHGFGHLFFTDSRKYIGEFRDGEIWGQGQYFIDNQEVNVEEWFGEELTDEEKDRPQDHSTEQVFDKLTNEQEKQTHIKQIHDQNSNIDQ